MKIGYDYNHARYVLDLRNILHPMDRLLYQHVTPQTLEEYDEEMYLNANTWLVHALHLNNLSVELPVHPRM